MLELSNWVHSAVGGIHLTSSVIGLITGLYILLTKKGDKTHKIIGYIFACSLLVVNISASFIFDFNNGSIGPFHYLIPVSLFCLIYGMIPMLQKNKSSRSLKKHIIGMNGAALGLWAAGAAELFVRELSYDLSKGELITYSFLISVPFAVIIGFNIRYFIQKYVMHD